MAGKFVLLSPAWFAALHQAFVDWAASNAGPLREILGNSSFTYQGVYTGVPPQGKSITYHCTIRAGSVDFYLTPVDRPDFNVIVPYDTLRQSVLTVIEDDEFPDAVSAYDAAGPVNGTPAITSEINCDPELWNRLSKLFFPAIHNVVPTFTLVPA